jgi:dolichol-phosphate mannosyltransferase
VVDDGSPDGTGDIVQSMGEANQRVHLLRREKKLGLGTAYIAGFKWALQNGYDYVFEMDADFSHDPGHLPEFLRAIETADLVLGSRYRHGKVTVVNWPINRLLLSYFANVYARVVTGLPLYDSTGGYKVYRKAVLEAIDLNDVRSNGYAFQIEMSFRAWRKKFRIVEIPIVFVDRTEGTSKLSTAIVREAIWMVWRLRLWAMTGRL